VVALFLSVILSGCVTRRSMVSQECKQQPLIDLAGSRVVIFPENVGAVDGYGGGEVLSFWTPTYSDVARVEPALRQYLKLTAPQLEARLAEYRRQYSGFVYGGKRLIYVNFLCGDSSSYDWQCGPIFVDDGGDCFFHLECDLDSSSCSKLWINGNA